RGRARHDGSGASPGGAPSASLIGTAPVTPALADTLPLVIQGGMGIGVSGWPLARAVSVCGQLGVVSGTAIDSLLVRRLQDGDIGGHVRRALAQFPLPGVAAATLKSWF